MQLVSLPKLMALEGSHLAVALPARDLRMVANPEVLAAAMDTDTRALAWAAAGQAGLLVAPPDTPLAGVWAAGVVAHSGLRPALESPTGWAQAVVLMHEDRPVPLRPSAHGEDPWDTAMRLLVLRQRALAAYLGRLLASGSAGAASLGSALDLLGWLPPWPPHATMSAPVIRPERAGRREAGWSLVAVPPSAAAHPAALARILDGLQAVGVAVLAATYVPGGPWLFDHLYQGNRPRAGGHATRSGHAFLSVHEYDGPTAVLLVDAPVERLAELKGPSAAGRATARQLRGRFALTTHRMSFVHVPDEPGSLAELLFGCGCCPIPAHLAGADRSAEVLALAESLSAGTTLGSEVTWGEVQDGFLARCALHADLLTLGPPGHCAQGPWRAGVLRWVESTVGSATATSPPTLAAWQLAHQDVQLTATTVELQILRAWTSTDAVAPVGAR